MTGEPTSTTADRCVVLLGTPIDDVSLPEALDRIAEMVQQGRATGRTHQVATVNVDFVVNAAHDESLRAILQGSDLSIPDGMGILWGARIVRVPLRERSSGVDLVPALAARTARDGWRLCLFGAAPGVAEDAASLLRDRFPGADVVGLEAPLIDADGGMDEAAAKQLRDLDADVVCVALGNPKQERWIDRFRSVVGAPVFIGIGGSLNFLTGVTRRAPMWIQRAGLEWVHRAATEPRRLIGRYAKDLVVFGPGILAQAWRGRRRDGTAPLVAAGADRTTIDVSSLSTLDNATVASLIGRIRSARRHETHAVIVGATPLLMRSARRFGVADLLVRLSGPGASRR